MWWTTREWEGEAINLYARRVVFKKVNSTYAVVFKVFGNTIESIRCQFSGPWAKAPTSIWVSCSLDISELELSTVHIGLRLMACLRIQSNINDYMSGETQNASPWWMRVLRRVCHSLLDLSMEISWERAFLQCVGDKIASLSDTSTPI